MSDAQLLLVDSAHGVYAWHSLVTRYPLFVSDGPLTRGQYVPFGEWLAARACMVNETIETVFHPDNEESSENIEYCAYNNILAVQNSDGSFWRIEQGDGDIWAINPLAVWNDETDSYEVQS
jgi:hypothetical protein